MERLSFKKKPITKAILYILIVLGSERISGELRITQTTCNLSLHFVGRSSVGGQDPGKILDFL